MQRNHAISQLHTSFPLADAKSGRCVSTAEIVASSLGIVIASPSHAVHGPAGETGPLVKVAIEGGAVVITVWGDGESPHPTNVFKVNPNREFAALAAAHA